MQKIQYKTDQKNPIIQAYREAVEKGKKDQHILPRENGWIIKNLFTEEESQTFGTQQQAIQHAETHVTGGTTIFIHGQNGLIVERKDY